MVSAAGKKIPVFTSPVVVITGKEAVPAAATNWASALNLATSVPPSAKAMVSAAGKKMPVFKSPVVVIDGSAAVPACTVVTPVADKVVNAPVLLVVAPTVPFMLIEAVPVKFVTVPLDGVPNAPPLTRFPLAVPVKAAVIVPAEKLPEASRATMADAVFADVAVVAELLTFKAVEIVASLVSTIPAEALMSALTITPAAILVAFPTDVTSPVKLAFVVTLPAVKPEAVPVMLVPTSAEGVPSAGVTKVGLVAKTNAPVPVSSVTAAARLAELGVARKVATFEPKPLTPVEIGKPVAFVRVAETGVPKAVTFPEASRLTDFPEG